MSKSFSTMKPAVLPHIQFDRVNTLNNLVKIPLADHKPGQNPRCNSVVLHHSLLRFLLLAIVCRLENSCCHHRSQRRAVCTTAA